MCNDYEQHVSWKAYCEAMAALEWGVPTGQSEADLPRSDDIRVRDLAPVIRAAGNSVELVAMRWSFPPARPGGKPVFNFRSEGRRFRESKRCLIPATAFFEFTGTKSPKTKHRFILEGEPFLCIAGLWRDAEAGELPTFTMLTTAPGPDVERYHDRQVVVLPPADWPAWIYLTRPEGELLRPLAAGLLTVETLGSSRR
jgi:putative SOS response-associated peptidase YedK